MTDGESGRRTRFQRPMVVCETENMSLALRSRVRLQKRKFLKSTALRIGSFVELINLEIVSSISISTTLIVEALMKELIIVVKGRILSYKLIRVVVKITL
jgi:hypothetical protein